MLELHEEGIELNRQEVTIAGLSEKIGAELGVSDWLEVSQDMIDQFAKTTRDCQWIHVDVERAIREGPYEAPIAHGFLTLSLVPALTGELPVRPKGIAATINYGLDRLRFLSPVRAGSRIRLRSKLLSIEERSPGRHLMKSLSTMEIEGEETPAFVAETLLLLIAAD